MAGQTLGSNVQVCATCGHWNGNRTPKMGGFVIINNEDGKCYVIDMQGVPKKALYGCGQWIKWAALK